MVDLQVHKSWALCNFSDFFKAASQQFPVPGPLEVQGLQGAGRSLVLLPTEPRYRAHKALVKPCETARYPITKPVLNPLQPLCFVWEAAAVYCSQCAAVETSTGIVSFAEGFRDLPTVEAMLLSYFTCLLRVLASTQQPSAFV